MSSATPPHTNLSLSALLEQLECAREQTDAAAAGAGAASPAPAPAPASASALAPASASAMAAAGGAGASAVSIDEAACTRPSLTEAERAACIDRVCAFIGRSTCTNLSLLRKREVVQWLFGDTSFLPAIHKKNKTQDTEENKKGEDVWGQTMMREHRPRLTFVKQWTNCFGECIAQEIQALLGKAATKPGKKLHFQPDLETADAIVEVKTGTYFTTGTAHEKILGTPFKYADIPALYGKPLKVLCIGGAESMARGYGLFPGEACTPAKRRQLAFWKEGGIEFVEATALLLAVTAVPSTGGDSSEPSPFPGKGGVSSE
jgi:hypothetical protein